MVENNGIKVLHRSDATCLAATMPTLVVIHANKVQAYKWREEESLTQR